MMNQQVMTPVGRTQASRASVSRFDRDRAQSVLPKTCARDNSAAESEFLLAMQAYKKSSGRMFPTWSEVLEVLRDLGYEKPVA